MKPGKMIQRMKINLRQERQRLGYDVRQLGRIAGVAHNTILNMEDTNNPDYGGTVFCWLRLSAALGHTGLDWLMVEPIGEKERSMP